MERGFTLIERIFTDFIRDKSSCLENYNCAFLVPAKNPPRRTHRTRMQGGAWEGEIKWIWFWDSVCRGLIQEHKKISNLYYYNLLV